MKNKRLPIYFTAPNGAERVRLPLAKNRGEAVFDRAVYEALIKQGYSSQMRLSSAGDRKFAYVRTGHPYFGECSLPRPITGAYKDQHIHYRDGNRLNLTLDNLVVTDRRGGFNPKCPLCRPRTENAGISRKKRTRRVKQSRKIPQISARPSISYRVAFTPLYPLSI